MTNEQLQHRIDLLVELVAKPYGGMSNEQLEQRIELLGKLHDDDYGSFTNEQLEERIGLLGKFDVTITTTTLTTRNYGSGSVCCKS
jgi:hypothetical protein